MKTDHTIWVDYTNWKGIRAWREIKLIAGKSFVEYLKTDEFEPEKLVLHVFMVDRGGARRSLNIANIHGWSQTKPGEYDDL